MSFIISITHKSKLFLGSVTNASDQGFLQSNHIGAVINCTHDASNFFQGKMNIQYLQIPIDDSPEQPIINYFDQAVKFVLENLKNEANPNIFIHCQFGVSRSATVTIAIIMKLGCFPFTQALKMVQARRPQVNPNSGFLKQLQQYEETLEGQEEIEEITSHLKKQAECDFLFNFKCLKCKLELFKSMDIVHGIPNQCQQYCLSLPNWLKDDHYESNDGKLNCPKCGNKLGDYLLSGWKCTCGEWIAPAYRVSKFKVDKKQWDSQIKQWI